ncbi:DUF1858 domain-containing protein [Geminicoccus roseus]|uniref:DUF1858 domain-containing protein n=1 Tax=Geminicoccus roseus TaxID=404900 RepID=UPI002AC36E42|nr:DUF1858 domain-containing protein [Geminicoccus roseus]
MSTHREVIPVFIRFRMHCIGCPIGHFHTVAEACALHGRDLTNFLQAVNASTCQPRHSFPEPASDDPTRATAPRA